MKEENVKITTFDWNIPMYGNVHSIPYGWLEVVGTLNDGTKVNKVFKTYGDKWQEHSPHQYIIINKQRYIVRNVGNLYYPKFEIEKWNKEKINGKWMYL